MNTIIKNKLVWLYGAVILLGLLLGLSLGLQRFSGPLAHASAQGGEQNPRYQYASLLPEPKVLPNVDLITQAQQPVQQSFWRDRWSLVFFGFTSCPDICPLELQKLAKVLRIAEDQLPLQVVFVSVDPERDTPEKLNRYAHFFHPDIQTLSGTNAQLAQLAQFFGAAYDRSTIIDSKLFRVPAGIDMPIGSGDYYQVNHSSRIFIVNPEGKYAGSFTPPFESEHIWGDLLALAE